MTVPVRMLGAAAIFAIAAPVSAQAQDAVRAPVQALDEGLLAIMKSAKQLGYQGRVGRIGQVVDRVFDLPLMTRLAVGPGWTTIAASDKSALVAAFRRMTISQYAANFNGWSGQAFTIDSRVDTRGTDRLVRTTLAASKGDPVSLAYRLRQTGGEWRIIDVFYQNSISQLATRRADFASILSKGGAKALIAHLDQLSAKSAR
ncbi:MAG: ABC transporter substrate-binding protein [Sphingomonadaceae bacterium]|nr:ABC transporter substrate-binding protein [Sphingomonadaceae bacterium]